MEQKINDLIKLNVNTLKLKSCELGIKELKSPYDLIQYARDLLNDKENLEQQVKAMQEKIDTLMIKQSNRIANANETSNIKEEKKQSVMLNMILNKIDPQVQLNGAKQPLSNKQSAANVETTEKPNHKELETVKAKATANGKIDEESGQVSTRYYQTFTC